MHGHATKTLRLANPQSFGVEHNVLEIQRRSVSGIEIEHHKFDFTVHLYADENSKFYSGQSWSAHSGPQYTTFGFYGDIEFQI